MNNHSSRRKRGRWQAALMLLSILTAACTSRQFGPRAVVPAQRGYNEALSRALDQQLLLNLVRLRYRENPLFLEFASIVAQFNRTASFGASLKLIGGASDEGGLSANVAAAESPVLTLVPVKGREFVQRMLAPIQPESLVALVQSGWGVERLLICCVQEIAGIRNADFAPSAASGRAPEFERFRELARALGDLHAAGGVDLAVADQTALDFDFGRVPAEAFVSQRATIIRLLGLAQDRGRFRLTAPRPDPRPGDVIMVGRSFYGILQLLAQGVEVPPTDEARGLVTVTRGDRLDSSRLLGGVFVTRTGQAPPADAVLAVSHRGHWFWIADDDRESKTTFSLLSLLTSLKSSETLAQTPVLAIGR